MTTALILGAAVWPAGPSPTLRRRTAKAAALYQAGEVTHIIPCGGLGQHPPTEAEAMRALLISMGIPPSAITLEDTSTNTFENIRNGLALAPVGGIVIVSDWYHLPRARLVARRLGRPAAGHAPSLKGARPLQQAKQALREVAAYIAYALKFRR